MWRIPNIFYYCIIFIITVVVSVYLAKIANPKDETDPVDGRSGFLLLIDSGTGCQYLQAGNFGGLSPRFDRNGNHICK